MILKIIFSRTHLLLLKIFNFVKFILNQKACIKLAHLIAKTAAKMIKKLEESA